METLITAFFNPAILRETAPYLWSGFLMTGLLTIVVVPLGLAGGLALALLSTVKIRALRLALVFYTDFFRAFPPLVLLMFIAFGLPFTGIDLPAFASVRSRSSSTPRATTARSSVPASSRSRAASSRRRARRA